MRTIKAFNLSPLHVEEDFGFLKQFHDEAVTLRGGSGGDSESPDEIADEVNPVLDGQISAFETKLDAFDEALKSSSSLPSTALATDADVERDSAWRGANAYVKAMTEHPDVATCDHDLFLPVFRIYKHRCGQYRTPVWPCNRLCACYNFIS